MNEAATIRAWLATQDGPRTVVEIAAGIGRAGDRSIGPKIHRMFRDGILGRSGQCRSYAFHIVRLPAPKQPRDERLRRKAEAERARQRRLGKVNRTWAAWKAECAAKREATRARQEAAKAQRAADRERERAERQVAREAARKAASVKRPKAPSKPRVVVPAKPLPTPKLAPPPAPVRMESVDEFLRRGGKVERLEVAWS